MRREATLIAMTFAFGAIASPAFAQLEWRVSVKFILDGNGHRAPDCPDCDPSGGCECGDLNTDEELWDRFNLANDDMPLYGRGYTFRLVEIIDLDLGPDAAFWFHSTRDDLGALGDAAQAEPVRFEWRDDAINLYIVGSNGGGGGLMPTFPWTPSIAMYGQVLNYERALYHEFGHVLNLCHTHGCLYGTTSPDPCPPILGDDGVSDTPPDCSDWDHSAYCAYQFGHVCNQSELNATDRAFHNLMSYHPSRRWLTSDQLDRMTDASNGPRANVTNGRTRFVDAASQSGFPNGSSTEPYRTFAEGLAAAAANDIVLLRVGNYDEQFVITQPVYLRASRGNAVIGQ